MRWVPVSLLAALVALLAAAPPPEAAAQAATCRFVLGFQTLHDLMPDVVGDCRENEHHNPANGDGLQRTTNGLLVWRKADNWTAFTDGYRTWVNGPLGLQERLNTERFAWETPPAPSAPPPAAPASYHATSPEYGISVFLWDHPDTTARDLTLLNQAQVGWQESLFKWRAIEGACKGCFDWSEADRVVAASAQHGVRILARLDYQPDWARVDHAFNGPPDNPQDYADFVSAFVGRYRSGSPYGHVDAIEIWNEPNLDRDWGGATIERQSAAEYVYLLKQAYAAAKAADPAVTVISAGLSPTCTNTDHARPDDVYLQWMYDAGLKGHYDVLGAHAPGYDAAPSEPPEESATRHNGCRAFTFRRVEDLRAIMERNGDGQKQIWITEFGWTTDPIHPEYAWFAVTPETKARYIVDAFRWAHDHWSPWIGVMTLWNLTNPSWGPEQEQYWWSVVNPDGSPRPPYTALVEARGSGALP